MLKRKKYSEKHAFQSQSGSFIEWGLHLYVLAGIALIVSAVLIAYSPSMCGGFIMDDDGLLTNNRFIMDPDGLYKFWLTTKAYDYWPVTNTSFWIEWRLWGTNPTGYRVTNLFLHVVESLLIWLILRKLSVPGAFLAAMIFAVHPVNVESVAWIAQRKNTMAMLFFLLSILWYLQFIERAHLRLAAKQCTAHCPPPTYSSFILHPSSFYFWYWSSLVMFVLAMLSKGSVAVLPVMLLGIIWWLGGLTKRDLSRTLPFFLVAVAFTGVNVWFQTHGKEETIRTAGFIERLLGAGGVVWFYLYKALLPMDLIFVYPQWNVQAGNLLWWLPLLGVLIVTAILWRYRKTWSRPFLFAWGFFCVALLPVMGFADVGFMKYSLVADHYQHIAIIGVVALAGAGWGIWRKSAEEPIRMAAMVVAVVAVGAFTFLTWRQSGLYRDAMTLYQATLEKNPQCWMAHYGVGLVLIQENRPQEAIEHFNQALQLKPDYAEAYNNLGFALIQTGRIQEAIEDYKQALRLKPDLVMAHNNLGLALIQTGRPEEAITHYKQVLQLNPDSPDAHYKLGNVLQKTGRLAEAIEQYEQASRLKPEYAETHYGLGLALAQAGRLPEAVEHYERALALKPNYPEALNNLGAALVQTGRPKEAIEYFKQALRLRPDHVNAYYNLALAHAKMRQSTEAIAAAQKALELARSQGQTALAKQIEDWLNAYRADLPDHPDTSPFSKSTSPKP